MACTPTSLSQEVGSALIDATEILSFQKLITQAPSASVIQYCVVHELNIAGDTPTLGSLARREWRRSARGREQQVLRTRPIRSAARRRRRQMGRARKQTAETEGFKIFLLVRISLPAAGRVLCWRSTDQKAGGFILPQVATARRVPLFCRHTAGAFKSAQRMTVALGIAANWPAWPSMRTAMRHLMQLLSPAYQWGIDPLAGESLKNGVWRGVVRQRSTHARDGEERSHGRLLFGAGTANGLSAVAPASSSVMAPAR